MQTKSRESGRKSPSVTLSEAIELLRAIHNKLSTGPFGRDAIAEAIGYSAKSGVGSSKIGALTHFGLLERTKSRYSISELGKRIVFPVDDGDTDAALREAALHPSLYREVFESYKERALPTMLPNVLMQQHRVSSAGRKAAAENFVETMKFAGLLRHGVLNDPSSGNSDSDPEPEGIDSAAHSSAATGTPATKTTPSIPGVSLSAMDGNEIRHYLIPLDAGGRCATLTMPIPFTGKDLDLLASWLHYMKTMMETTSPASSERNAGLDTQISHGQSETDQREAGTEPG